MDEKHNHRLDIITARRQRKDVKSYMHSISRFLHTQKQSLLTGFLLIVAAMLLFGIFSQFQPPRTSISPDGATVLDYRTFIEQVKTRNVPTVFFVLILLLALAPKGTSRSFRSLDDRVTGIGKNRAHLFERVKETAEPRQTGEKTASDRTAAKKVQGDLEPPATFADVAGIDEVRIEVEEIVQFLRSPERFSRLGARIPRGALLVGPPGTGKTLLAKAVSSLPTTSPAG